MEIRENTPEENTHNIMNNMDFSKIFRLKIAIFSRCFTTTFQLLSS